MKKIIILTLISLAFNSYGQELIFKTNNKSYKGNLKIEQTLDEKDILFKEIVEKEWVIISENITNFQPEILNQKESFNQNYDKIINQKREVDYIYTNLKTGLDFIKETKIENKQLTENLTRNIIVEKISETNSEHNNCTDWIPDANSMEIDTEFEQSRNCDINKIETYQYKFDNIVLDTKQIESTVREELRQNAIGTLIVNKVCKVQLTNLKPSGSYSAALGYISFNLNDGSKFDFGSVITKTRTSAVFTNANISSSTTWNNGNYYWVHLAIDGFEGSSHNGTDYWLGSSSASQTFTINFNKGESIKSISLKDKATCVTNCRGTKAPYDINLYDCNNNIIKTYTINTQLSINNFTIGTLIFD